MGIILAFAVAGGLAQLIDGTLGMGFGVASATILLLLGVAPAAASAATHAAKIPTTLTSGLAHWREGNVDWKIVLRIAVPGAITAFLGAVVLTGLSLSSAKVWMSGLLLFFGTVILLRFAFGINPIPRPKNGHSAKWLSPLGAVGGFVDATGGGGWGPVCTPALMTVTKHEPRKVVGSVNTAEFFVAVAASLGFLTGAGQHDIPWVAVGGLVIGGVLVAPIAARLAGRLPQGAMGTLVGGLIIIVNSTTILKAMGLPGTLGWVLLAAATAATAVLSWVTFRRESGRKAAVEPSNEDVEVLTH